MRGRLRGEGGGGGWRLSQKRNGASRTFWEFKERFFSTS